jgi:hemoglobin
MKSLGLSIFIISLCSACASFDAAKSSRSSIYEQFGGQPAVELVVAYFIDEIGYDKTIYAYFQETDVDRFTEKMTELICVQLDGPCTYTGDSMEASHKGMKVTEKDFNRLVDLLIAAMDRAEIAHNKQNQLLAKLAPMRKDILAK